MGTAALQIHTPARALITAIAPNPQSIAIDRGPSRGSIHRGVNS
jgi:hypothetical protein